MRSAGISVGEASAPALGTSAAVLALLAVVASPAAGETPGDIALRRTRRPCSPSSCRTWGRGASQSPERYAYLRKLDGHLQAVAASRLGTGARRAGRGPARQGVTTSPGGTCRSTCT